MADAKAGFVEKQITGNKPDATPRRNFLTESSAVVIGGVVAVCPVAIGMVPFFDPLRRGSGGPKEIRVAPLEAVPDDGVPRRFPIITDQVDGWTTIKNEPIGAVYLMREKDSPTVHALNAVCPHAGCFVGYSAAKKLFECPCHTSAFAIDGKRRLDLSQVPPRDMDKLSCEVRDGAVWVKFQNFVTGIEDQKAKA